MSAERTDTVTGVVDRALFLGEDPNRVFSVVHEPSGEPDRLVLVCPSVYVDRIKTYRPEVILGRTLASNGSAVQRFHYRGFGNSGGSSIGVTFSQMLDDARMVLSALRQTFDGKPVAIVGIRWGALIAAALAAEVQSAPLALWEPVPDGSEFFKEAVRAQRMAAISGTNRTDEPQETFDEALARQGWADLLGFTVGQQLRNSAAELSLADLPGSSPRQVMVAHAGQLSSKVDAVVEQWREYGSDVAVEQVARTGEAWWLVGGPRSAPFPTDGFVSRTADWIARTEVQGD